MSLRSSIPAADFERRFHPARSRTRSCSLWRVSQEPQKAGWDERSVPCGRRFAGNANALRRRSGQAYSGLQPMPTMDFERRLPIDEGADFPSFSSTQGHYPT